MEAMSGPLWKCLTLPSPFHACLLCCACAPMWLLRDVQIPTNETALVARCRRVFSNAHAYHINSISCNRWDGVWRNGMAGLVASCT